MNFGAILAGGKGTRMSISELPKQFMMLGNKPIIIHTLEKILLSYKIDVIYLGIHEDWMLYMEDLMKKYINITTTKEIHIVSGGKDRNETIMNIIKDIERKYPITEKDIILTHDAVRPFLNSRIIEENIDIMKECNACDTVISSIDTIVVSENGKTISDIPNRVKMYQGQTPQTFKVMKLKKLYYSLSEEEKNILTDACKIFYIRGEEVRLVTGDITNLKITTPADYEIAQSMIGGKN
ncbi:Ribitol-5-phosphate cytidylyltransferase [Fusobacterium necrophorum]|nr:2-C-methyl-D-erythritol 4-phosphate cytidylyltransferase [Fusobacterium necrophorum]MBR8823892.1 Ribitol-5-phosphate cytidylyltransferase [Fusobacterium necrophorum]